jgi:hypothetical protein
MQTFLPYPSFRASAMALDNRRLGKQRVEALQILNALADASYGWQRHPAVRMWRGCEHYLVRYGLTIVEEWKARGFKDTCMEKIAAFWLQYPMPDKSLMWLTEDLCRSHQSNLVRKDPNYYSPQFPDVPNNLAYVWPNQQPTNNNR